ncbi:MAG: hypothetical protein V7644_148 [Actinomycetota bacterium]|jgi:cytidylate kinase
MARDVVCISYASGAGGEQVGRLVAERLGFLYVDEEIVARAAEQAGVDPGAVADEERRKSMFENLMEAMAHGGGATGAAPVFADEVPGEHVREYIRDAVQEVAEHGNAVIAAHAASYAVRSGTRQLRVLVTAPRETRTARLALAQGLDEAEAGKILKRSDAGRADYLKRFYGVGEELPTHYDLVLNSETISIEDAAALVVEAAVDRPSSETSSVGARSR